jgi:zinc protease
MPSSSSGPLWLEYGEEVAGLRVVRQSPPTGAASFSASYVGPAGWGFDPVGEEGVGRVATFLTTVAAGPHDRVALARRLDHAGATLSSEVDPEMSAVTIWGPAADWKSLMALLAQVVLEPRFDPEDVARVRRQMFERQLRQRTQPASRAELELLRAIFPRGHPYRGTGLGDRASVSRISSALLRRFHRGHFTSGGASLVVTVPDPLRSVERVARDEFGSFPVQSAPSMHIPALVAAPPARVEVNLPGRSQVEIRVGGPSIARSAPDYPAAFLANETLGGRPMLARLFQRVREQHGLAYHASSHLDTMRLGGIWTAAAGTGGDRWKKVVPMLEQEVDRLRRVRVPDRELRSVQTSAIGEMPLALETTDDAHDLAVDAAYHQLPADVWQTWPDRLRSVTSTDLRQAARSAFNRSRSVTVIVGPIRAR